ncbi:FAD-dependent oxidoreductase [Streptomyces xylophagus]|uniref:FAD-dependent oxidoreductase n=1 Tax=Streptomyces xylophagus TaxID=285514 RepID=UPI0005BB4224|nr:NAD(P)/FAD-dependent oxidoreductase [Streptomyces xylophagus]
MSETRLRVMVIGAGLGGLCLAQGLRRRGVDVTVYERDDALLVRNQGYRLYIDPTGDRVLRESLPAELYDLFRATAGYPPLRIVKLDDQVNETRVLEDDPDETPISVDRLTLRQILFEGLADHVAFGKKLVRYDTSATGDGPVTAHFADGTTATGDVLIAADGVNSAVRRQYLPHARIMDSGVRQIYGKVPLDDHTRGLFRDVMFNVFTPLVGTRERYMGIGPHQPDEPVAQAAARLTPGAELHDSGAYMACYFGARVERFPHDDLRSLTSRELHQLALNMTKDWHPGLRAIIEHWLPDAVFPLTLRTSIPIPAWPTTPVTLLGDAIHTMSPAGGAGANTALRDAAALTEALAQAATGAPLIPELRKYEADMTAYGFAAVRESARDGAERSHQNPLPTD